MDNISYIALSGQIALRRNIDVIANNIANVNTQAFKSESVRFRAFLERTGPGKFNEIAFTDEVGKIRNKTVGNLEFTNNPFDLAINGEGYFTVETDKGIRYTRHGKFNLNEQGFVTTSAGHRLLQAGNLPLQLPLNAGSLEISAAGGVVDGEGNNYGQVNLVTFPQNTDLIRTEDNLYFTNDPVLPQNVANPAVVQGALEGSNVQAVSEMTKLISAHHTHTKLASLLSKENDRQIAMVRALGGSQGQG